MILINRFSIIRKKHILFKRGTILIKVHCSSTLLNSFPCYLFTSLCPKINILLFHKEFVSMAGQRRFNLDKRGDCKDIVHIILQAYKKTIDPFIVTKITKLHLKGCIVYNKKFLEDLATLLKKNVFYT